MAVSSPDNSTAVTLTALPQEVPFAPKFFASSDLVVTVTDQTTLLDTVLTISTHYTVSGGNGAGGTVTILDTSAVAVGDTITVERVIPYTQDTALPAGTAFPSAVVEQRLDRLTIQILQLKAVQERCIRFGATSGAIGLGDLKDPTSKVLMIGADDTPTGLTVAQLAVLLALELDGDVYATALWANDAARALAVPAFVGQFGAQLDTGVTYIATGLSAGNWAATSVVSAQIADGAILAAKLASNAVEAAKIAAGAVTGVKLASELTTWEITIPLSPVDADATTGDGKAYWTPMFAGTITGARLKCPKEAPTGSAVTCQLNDGTNDVFSTALTIDATETDSADATTPVAINPTYSSFTAGAKTFRADLDTVGSSNAARGIYLILTGTRTYA